MVTVGLNGMRCKAITYHKSKNLIAIVGDRSLKVFSYTKSEFKEVITYIDENIKELFSAVDFIEIDGKDSCVIGGKIGVIKMIDLTYGKVCGYITAHSNPITHIESIDNKFVTSSKDSTIKLWSIENFKCLSVLEGLNCHSDSVISFCINPNNKNMLSNGSDLRIIEWYYKEKKQQYLPVFIAYNNYRCHLSSIIYYGNLIVCLCKNERVLFLKPIYRSLSKSLDQSSYGNGSMEEEQMSKTFMGRDYPLPRTSDLPFYSTAVFYSPMISVENVNFHEDSLEIAENFQLVKEITLGHSSITKIIVFNHILFCLSTHRFIYTVDLNHLFRDYHVNKIKITRKLATCDFTVSETLIFVVFEDGVIESIEHNKKL